MVKKTRTRQKRVTIVPRNAVQRTKKQEVTLLGKALRSLGGFGGGALGGLMGMAPAGAAAGNSLGAAISKWLGSGDYSVSSNSIISGAVKASTGIPAMHSAGQSVVVRHKEYIGQLTSSINFAIRYSLPINPGKFDTFPWLANIAKNFQEYSMKGMVFHYIPSSGSAIASTNNALGTAMFQTTYRASDTAPSSKHELLNEYWAGESVPSEVLCHPIECDPKENPFKIQYTRSGEVPAGDSKLLYDLGTTYIAVSGQQANDVVLGDIWVTYEVELRKPILFSNVHSGAEYVNYQFLGGTHTNADFFPANSTITSDGLLAATGVAGTRTVSIPVGLVGDFMISFTAYSTAGVTNWTTSGASVLVNCTLTPAGAGAFDADNAILQTTSTVTRNLIYNVLVRKVNKDVVATATLPIWNASAGSVENAQLRVAVTSI